MHPQSHNLIVEPDNPYCVYLRTQAPKPTHSFLTDVDLSNAPPLPSEMLSSEFVCRSYLGKIDLDPQFVYPMKLEDYLNFHLSDFAFVGVIPSWKMLGRTKNEISNEINVAAKTKPVDALQSPETGTGWPFLNSLLATEPRAEAVFGISLSELYGEGPEAPHIWEAMFSSLSSLESVQTIGL